MKKSDFASSVAPHEAWRDVLETGQIPGDVEPNGWVRVSCAALYDEYFVREHLRATGDGPRERVTTDLRRRVKSTMYRVPPLAEVRAAYSARGRGAPTEWEEQDRWTDSREGDFEVLPDPSEDDLAGKI